MKITKRQARKKAIENGFRSKFEYEFSKKLKELKLNCQYEKDKITYIQPEKLRTYIPDWTIKPTVFIETKGRFTTADRQKMINVIKSNPFFTFYLIFQNSKVTLSKISKTTYGDWCDKHGIIWADIKDTIKWKGWFK